MGKEIDKIRTEMQDEGYENPNTKRGMDFLVKNIEELTEGKAHTLIQELKRTSDHRIVPRIGKFYMFNYLAKHRNTLPYYDRFPMMIVLSIHPKEEYMIGLNLHYLPLKFRAKFFKNILMFLNNKKWDDTTKFKVSWDLMKSLSIHPLVQPAVKRYNFAQLRSKFIIIEEDEWDIAVMLPTHLFKGAPVTQVWAESVSMINRRKPRKTGTIKPKKTTTKKPKARKP